MRQAELRDPVQKLPDDEPIDLERLMYTLYVRRKIEEGLADAEAGREVSLDEIDAMIDAWRA